MTPASEEYTPPTVEIITVTDVAYTSGGDDWTLPELPVY